MSASSDLVLGAQLRCTVFGVGGLTFKAGALVGGTLLGGVGGPVDAVGLVGAVGGDVVGSFLGGFEALGLALVRLALGGGLLGGALSLGGSLLLAGLRVGRLTLGAGLLPGLAELLDGLLLLGVRDGRLGHRLAAVPGLGLLELALLDEIVLARHGSGDLLGLAGHGVEEPFTCF
ncbi:MAG: hypothetical protein ACXVFM_07865 [Solirubrobacteraceae bacterium]